MDLQAIFKAYDVRGTYPDQIDEIAARNIGAAFAAFTGAPSIVLGRDMRLSSEPLATAFSTGVTAQGVDVVDVGLVSTDTLFFASGRLSMPGAMFTASHNPGHYNGIKLCLAGAKPVGQDTGLAEVRRLGELGVPPAAERGEVRFAEITEEFVDHALGFVEPEKFRPLKVVVDAANGMAGRLVPPVFAKLPCRLIDLYFDLDGTFPNHPADPIQLENLRDLQAKVLEEEADLGLAFDGDADRVFLVDEKAQPISGSLTTALVAKRILAANPEASIVHNLICSRVVPETIIENGGTPIRTRVGHSFIKQVMADTGAAFGGEHSGHYYFRDNYRADSGIICALIVLETLSEQGLPASEVLLPFRRYWNSGEINTRVPDPAVAIEAVAKAFGDGEVDRLDGLTVNYPDWWFNLRGSNTEPLLRLNVEAAAADVGEAMAARLVELISKEG